MTLSAALRVALNLAAAVAGMGGTLLLLDSHEEYGVVAILVCFALRLLHAQYREAW